MLVRSSDNTERRVDASTGGAFSKEEFIDYYGGTSEWETSVPLDGDADSSNEESDEDSDEDSEEEEEDWRRQERQLKDDDSSDRPYLSTSDEDGWDSDESDDSRDLVHTPERPWRPEEPTIYVPSSAIIRDSCVSLMNSVHR